MAQSTKTDPRFHAAYQRGYAGPAPERVARAEEGPRRPRRGRAASATETPVEPVRGPAPATASALPTETGPAREEEDPVEQTTRPLQSAIDGRIPIVLTVVGVALLVAAFVMLAQTRTFMWDGSETEMEQYVAQLLSVLPAPALTIGFVSMGAALIAQILRTSRG